MGKPVLIAGVRFPSKAHAARDFQDILHRYKIGETLCPVDRDMVLALLELHPERDAKVGCGVLSVQVEAALYGSRCFWVTRTDGSRTDFSYRACLRPPTAYEQAMAALRHEVEMQIYDFRAKSFRSGLCICAVTGVELRSDEAHVDHVIPFLDLAKQWAELTGRDLDKLEVNPTTDGCLVTYLTDGDAARSWSSFHQQNAKLRIVSRIANLSLLRRKGGLSG